MPVSNDEWVGIDDIRVTSNASTSVVGQTVGFSPGTVSVSHDEGNSGSTVYQFTVERSGGTDGDVSFSGTIASAQTDASDFVGSVPSSFSGVIPAGQGSATVTVMVAGDTTSEPNENFTLTLQSASNSTAVATTIGTAQATGITSMMTSRSPRSAPSRVRAPPAEWSARRSLSKPSSSVISRMGIGDNSRNPNGFYVQEEVTDSDGNVLTPEAIFVFGGTATWPSATVSVSPVRSASSFGLTELTATNISVVEAGAVADINTMATVIDLPGAGTTLMPGRRLSGRTSKPMRACWSRRQETPRDYRAVQPRSLQ